MYEIKLGNRVTLTSGGPLMIVESFTESVEGKEKRVNCRWHDEKELLRGEFRVSSLELAMERVD
jgi:uncharacterized protein YodC (DUF2158 family)